MQVVSIPSVQEPPVKARIEAAFHSIVKGHKETRARNPVDQQFIAAYLSAEQRGEPVSHPSHEHFRNLLHESVKNLVLKVCQKYVVSSQADINDLSQDCYLRITRRIGTFNHCRAKFSTWCWKVCVSTLNSGWRRQAKHTSHLSDVEDIENFEAPTTVDPHLISDIVKTIRHIARKYPRKRHILYGMFGKPGKGLCLPEKIHVSKVAREVGIPYGEAYAFYRDIVKKIFRERMGETI